MIFLNPILRKIQRIAEIEFEELIETTFEVNCKLRIVLHDKSFIDVGVSQKLANRFSIHWERVDGSMYRYDNFPDKQWRSVPTFPFHFHKGSQNIVEASPFPPDVFKGFREFMKFVRERV